MSKSKYIYFDVKAPERKINYSFSKYMGMDFIDAWKTSRTKIIRQYCIDLEFCSVNDVFRKNNSENCTTMTMFKMWCSEKDKIVEYFSRINVLLKRFEVTKKIYSNYDTDYRPIDKARYLNYDCYCGFGILLVNCYETSHKLQYLNALLKVIDILCSIPERLSEHNLSILKLLIEMESQFINMLIGKKL